MPSSTISLCAAPPTDYTATLVVGKGKPRPNGVLSTITPPRAGGKCSRYLTDAVDPKSITKIVREAVRVLRSHKDDYDCIAVTGLSGLLIAPIVALRLKKPLVVVRVKGISTHADCKIEAGCTIGRYMVLDDICRSGHTIETIVNMIAGELPLLKPVALYLYREDECHGVPLDLPIWSRTAKLDYESGVSRLKSYYPEAA